MEGAMRLSALSELGVIYVLTLDYIGLDGGGPTHQPIESLTSMRSVPNMVVIRPVYVNETSGAYKVAVDNRQGPTVLFLSHRAMANHANSSTEKVDKSDYILQVRWVTFTGQFRPLTSLTPGGRISVHSQCRPHGEFCLPVSCAALHGSTSTGIGTG